MKTWQINQHRKKRERQEKDGKVESKGVLPSRDVMRASAKEQGAPEADNNAMPAPSDGNSNGGPFLLSRLLPPSLVVLASPPSALPINTCLLTTRSCPRGAESTRTTPEDAGDAPDSSDSR